MENTFIPVAVINNPKIRDYYICGDLHGMYSILMNALGKTGFDPTQDKLICTGDIVDYGWQNEKCIELLDKDWFLSVRGEHEQTIINALKSETFQYEHLMNGGDWLYELPLAKHIEIAQRFSKLPYAIEIHHQGKIYGVVHADVLGNSWNVFKNSLTKKGLRRILSRNVHNHALWSDDRFYKPPIQTQPIIGIDMVFFGHNITLNAFRRYNYCYIDTGATFAHKITLLKLSEENIQALPMQKTNGSIFDLIV